MRAKLPRTSSRQNFRTKFRQRSWLALSVCVGVTLFASILWHGLPQVSPGPPRRSLAETITYVDRSIPPPELLAVPEVAPGDYMKKAGGSGKKLPSLVVRYAACGGLFNQHYCHIAGIAMAIALGADSVIMPPAMRRNKFAVDARTATWTSAPASSVWDLQRLRAYTATKGMDIHEVPTLLPSWVPDGFGAFNPFGLARHQVVRFPYMANELFTMEDFVRRAHQRIVAYISHLTQGPSKGSHASMRWREVSGELVADLRANVPHWAALREENASRSRPDSLLAKDERINSSDWREGCQVWELLGKYLVNESFAAEWGFPLHRPQDDVIPNDMSDPNLQDGYIAPMDTGNGDRLFHLWQAPQRLEVLLPCVLFAVRSQGSPLMSEVALNLHFAPQLHDAANRIIHGMAWKTGKPFFNGLHLRLEADAAAWIEMFGGLHALWSSYINATTEAGFNTTTPVYIASGIFSNMTPANKRHLGELQDVAASAVFDKTRFLGRNELHRLHSEQRAAVDFLVLAQSQGFVGFVTSTFSIFIQQYQQLHGIEKPPPVFVDVPALHEFTKDMMRQGAQFDNFPRQPP